ncbi:MAG TPA: type II toxin-antitoxin system RelE/ParE family toxin [bacterium]
MRGRITFHELAEHELNEAADYYNSKSEGLGNVFLSEVERAVNQILHYPESSPCIYRVVRRKLVRRFPYSIMYSVTLDHVRILAIANQKRRPFYWHDRV